MALGFLIPLADSAHAQRRYVDPTPPTGGNQSGLNWQNPMPSLQQALDWAWLQPSGSQIDIWVTEGTYTPSVLLDPLDNKSATFHLPPNTRLYGGFRGITDAGPAEQSISARSGDLFTQTVLTGELITGRIRHVVYISPALSSIQNFPSERAEINGFKIESGLASGTLPDHNVGAGIFARDSSLIIRNCEFEGNTAFSNGGAVYWDRTNNGALTVGLGVSKSRFSQNSSLSGQGGAIFASLPLRIYGLGFNANPNGTLSHITNCEFDANVGGRSDEAGAFANQGGGAVALFHAKTLEVTGNVFSYNEARGNGSALLANYEYGDIQNPPTRMWIANNTFFGNEAKDAGFVASDPNLRKGGVIYSLPKPQGAPTNAPYHYFSHNIVWGNTVTNGARSLPDSTPGTSLDIIIPEANYQAVLNDLEGPDIWNVTTPLPGGGSGGNLNVDPLFQSTLLNDFRIQSASPCRNIGSFAGSVDHGDVDDDLSFHLEQVPFALDIPALFFKAPATGVARQYSGVDIGAMERN